MENVNQYKDYVEVETETGEIKNDYIFSKEEYLQKPYFILGKEKLSGQKKILTKLKTDTFENEQQRSNLCNVLKFQLRNHKHRGMVQYERLIRDKNGLDIYLVQQFNQYGLMKNLIESAYEKERPFKEDFVKQWLAYLLTAVHGLHKDAIVHGNIHVSNIYMEKDALFLGPSERFIRLIEDPKSFTGRGEFWNWKTQDLDDLERSNYLPPEVLGQKKSGSETDIWCIGVTIHFMASCCYPFQGSTPASVEDKVLRKPPNFVNFEKLSPELKEVLSRCLDKDPSTRATSAELVAHPYIKDLVAKVISGDSKGSATKSSEGTATKSSEGSATKSSKGSATKSSKGSATKS